MTTMTETKQGRAERTNRRSRLPKVMRAGKVVQWAWSDRTVQVNGTTVYHWVNRETGVVDVAGWPFGGKCETRRDALKLALRECREAGLRAEYEDDDR